jgi:hypothetical protein
MFGCIAYTKDVILSMGIFGFSEEILFALLSG